MTLAEIIATAIAGGIAGGALAWLKLRGKAPPKGDRLR